MNRETVLVSAAFAAMLVAFIVLNVADVPFVPSLVVFIVLFGLYVAARVYSVRRRGRRTVRPR